MEHTEILVGAGWLRAAGSASSTASYCVTLRRLDDDASSPILDGGGVLRCELTTMLEVEETGRGVLVLEDGKRLDIKLVRISAGNATFALRN